MKRKQVIIPILSLLLVLLFISLCPWINKVGRIGGAENEWIEIDGTRYLQTDDAPYSGADRGQIIGRIDGNYSAHAFRVKGDPNGSYVYVAAMGYGEFYKIDD